MAATEWQTYSTATAKGLRVGIALYRGEDTLQELERPEVFTEATEANKALAELDEIVRKLNAKEQP